MIPKQQAVFFQKRPEETAETPSRTYRVDHSTGRVRGMAEGREALQQAVWKILMTGRFAHAIYSWNYGAELGGLAGAPAALARARLPRLLREALLADERFQAVEEIEIRQAAKNCLLVSFVVHTREGALPTSQEVRLIGG